MQTPLRIVFDGAEASEAVEARVRSEMESLEKQHSITRASITVHAPPRHRHKGGLWTVGVTLTLPSGEIRAGREAGHDHAHEDPYVAVRDAFAAARRQLQEHAHRTRGDVKTHETP